MSPPAAAEAAKVVAAEPQGPVDLTQDVFAVGEAEAYAGGSTRSGGTSKQAVRGPVAPPGVSGGAGSEGGGSAGARGRDRSRPMEMLDPDWRCPWPREADVFELDRQVAVVRVTVGADGRVASVRIVDDPGLGFGRAAEACARRARFAPARDRDGKPIRSTSSVRVHFTR